MLAAKLDVKSKFAKRDLDDDRFVGSQMPRTSCRGATA